MNRIDGFDWDDGNRAKCQRRGLSIAEIESVFEGSVIIIPDDDHSVVERRLRAIGRAASGRHVFVVFTMRRSPLGELIRPISARYMHRKESSPMKKPTQLLKKIPTSEAMRRPRNSWPRPTSPNTTSRACAVRFEFQPKSARVNMRLPESLLKSVKARASKRGIPYQRFIREALEEAVTKDK